MVVLAACHSGQRAVFGRGLDALPGDDLFGLQAVFFEAGAWGVLGTLWPVDDETAREIMTAFHRAYASGVPPDAALQQAMAQYLTNPEGSPSPLMLAPFVLVTLGRHPGTPAS
jgi:CHAT domain-containing protein